MNSNTTNTITVETLTAQERVLAKAKAALKAAQEQAKWEAATKARNPAFVLGSVRAPTPADIEVLGHTHGKVCDITCSECGKTRTINLQDAFQCKFCVGCKKVASRDASKAKRATKRLAGRSVEDLQREIEEANAALAALTATAAAG